MLRRGHSELNQGPIDLQSIALPLSYIPKRSYPDLNHGPIGLQPIALPLSYIPKTDAGGVKCSDTHGR